MPVGQPRSLSWARPAWESADVGLRLQSPLQPDSFLRGLLAQEYLSLGGQARSRVHRRGAPPARCSKSGFSLACLHTHAFHFGPLGSCLSASHITAKILFQERGQRALPFLSLFLAKIMLHAHGQIHHLSWAN